MCQINISCTGQQKWVKTRFSWAAFFFEIRVTDLSQKVAYIFLS
jgi:hypothetical protein